VLYLFVEQSSSLSGLSIAKGLMGLEFSELIADLRSPQRKGETIERSPFATGFFIAITPNFVRQAFGENQTQPLANDSTEQRTTTVLCGNYIPFLGVNRDISFKYLHNVLFKAHIHH